MQGQEHNARIQTVAGLESSCQARFDRFRQARTVAFGLVRRYCVTDAAVHDSQVVEDILDPDNTASDVWADSAYRSAEIPAWPRQRAMKTSMK